MIYLRLFLEFMKIGLFTFGGAYGAIPLIRETVLDNEWMSEEMFSNMLAISESTPGSIMVNAATYVGNTQSGVLGASVATFGVVLPSFAVIILICVFLKKYFEKSSVKAILSGVKPCVAGIILATGIFMALGTAVKIGNGVEADYKEMVIFVLLTAVLSGYGKIAKKSFSPILLICISAVLGIVL